MGDSALSTVTQIGFTLAGPFGAAIGAGLGAFVANELFGQDIETSRGRIADLKVATSEYGFPIAHIWGCMRVGGSAYFNSDLIEKKVTDSSSAGGKGGGSTVKSTTFFYSIDIGYKLAINLANFPVVSMPKGWGNGKLLWDFSNETGPIFSAKYVGDTGGPFNQGTLRLRFGAEDQLPDPTYEVYGGVGTTPSDRGYATVIGEDFPLEDFGNSPFQLNAIVCTAANPLSPVDSMTTWTANTQDVFFAPDGRTLYDRQTVSTPSLVNSDTREFIIDGNVTLEPLIGTGNSNGNAPQGFYDIDRHGRGLSADQTLAGVLTPFLHDITDYSVIARSNPGDSGIVASGASMTFFGLNDERILILGNSGNAHAVYNAASFFSVTSGEEESTFTGNLIPHIVTGTDWADFGLSTFPRFAMDGQTGHIWTAHTDGADFDLVHWSLDWLIIEQFVVTGRDADSMGYDDVSHSFFFADGTDNLYRWSIDDQAVHPDEITGVAFSNVASGFASIHEGLVYLEGGGSVTAYDIPNMVVHKTYDLDNGSLWNLPSDIDGSLYDPFLHAVIVSPGLNTPVYWAFLDRGDEGSTTLEAILNDEVLLSGYEGGAADRDATDHSAVTVLGWAANARTPVVGESGAQAALYKFGHVEVGHKIEFPARGRATTFALTDDDLGVTPFGSEPGRKLFITRLDQSDLDVRSEVRFVDPALDYQEGLQRAVLVPDTVPGTDKEGSRSFKAVLTNEEALRREFLHLTQQYADQQRYKFSLFHHHLTIVPGDTGTITSDGVVHLVMIDETALGANFIYEVSAVGFVVPTTAEADAILTQIHTQNTSLAAATPDGFIAQTIDSLNPTDLLMIDNVFLDDIVDQGNDTLEYQFAAMRRSASSGWSGAIISQSPDNAEFNQWHLYEADFEGTIGRTETALGQFADFTVIDDTNSVDIQIPADVVLASVTDVELLAGENAFLIGQELLFAGTVVDNTNGRWTLSHFLRGRRGTEHAIGIEYFQVVAPDHTQWEKVAYLGTVAAANKAMFRGAALTDLNVANYYRTTSLGAAGISGMSQLFTNTGGTLKPYSPIPIAGSKSGSDWNGTITRRNRTGWEMRDLADIPATDPENYEIDIYQNHLVDDTVIRTLTATATANGSVVNSDGTWVYDQLDMESDFSESPIVSPYPLYRLRVVAYQVNPDTVGRGWPGTAILDDRPEPPPADASFANVSLLLEGNSLDVMDKSSNSATLNPGLTVGSALTLTEGDWKDGISAFGSAVIEFSDVAASHITIDRSVIGTLFDFGSGDFTLEAWVHQDGEHGGAIIGIWGDAPNKEWLWAYVTGATDNGSMRWHWTTNGTSVSTNTPQIASGESFGLIHVAFTRTSGTGQLYRNGAALGSSFSFSDTIFSGGTANLTIGTFDETGPARFEGKLDSLRVTKASRYSGSTYTIPNNRFAHN